MLLTPVSIEWSANGARAAQDPDDFAGVLYATRYWRGPIPRYPLGPRGGSLDAAGILYRNGADKGSRCPQVADLYHRGPHAADALCAHPAFGLPLTVRAKD